MNSFDRATQFFDYREHHTEDVTLIILDLDGPSVCHEANDETRETACGLEVGTYPEGWCWGSEKEVDCDDCKHRSIT